MTRHFKWWNTLARPRNDPPPKCARSAGKVTTWNLLKNVQHNSRNHKLPMPNILSGGAPRQTPPKWLPETWARSSRKTTTCNLLQTVQHNPTGTRFARCLWEFMSPNMSPWARFEELQAAKLSFNPPKRWMEALEHSHFFRRPVFCSVFYFFETVSEIELQPKAQPGGG